MPVVVAEVGVDMTYRCSFPVGSAEYLTVRKAVNQGIDAWLEAFTASKFEHEGGRLVCRFAEGELPILLRRLNESGSGVGDSLADRIVYSAYGFEVVQARGRAASTVSKAVRACDLAIIVPTHRTLDSVGRLRTYPSGLWRKKYLLELEAWGLIEFEAAKKRSR